MSSKQERILYACRAGGVEELQALLQTFNDSTEVFDIRDPKILNASLAAAMLEIAAASENRNLIDCIFRQSQKIPITEQTILSALGKGSIPLYSTLLSHDPAIIHMPIFQDRDSQLGFAMRCLASVQFIEFLLDLGLDPNPDRPAMPPLCMANLSARDNSLELCRLLLDHGARLEHSSALASAARHERIDVMEYLIERGADVNDVLSDELCGHVWAPLHTAVRSGRLDAVELLMKNGADVEMRDERGMTAVEVAADVGDERIMELLDKVWEKSS